MASIAVKVVVEKLASLLAQEAQFLGGVRRGVSELRDDLESMRSFLHDAESRIETENGVKTWVKQVRDAAHDTEDILDEFSLRLSVPPRQGQNGDFILSLRRIFHQIRQLRTRHRLAVQIEDVKRKIKHISDRRNAFSFRRTEEVTMSLGKAFFKGFRMLGLLELDRMLVYEFPPELSEMIHLRLPNLPKWIASLEYLGKLVLQYSNLKDDPLKALQGLPNLVILELRDAYAGKELRCEVSEGYPRLKKLGLMILRQLKSVRVEQGAMAELRELDIASCEKLETVPSGIQHLGNLKDLTVWDMPREFNEKIERPDGEDSWMVQHVTNIQVFL
ncbi:hypothetical protein RHSIM_Rhsim12G0122700 [Rhododendron simsii]|uniref:Rx N-terminal domain-containing protein n=1 Tax=Rhododendron simsii TaxID=118357 RepID=A0A834G3U7_RHOSS|nr:hypothetical protein RHSIM_Rhsim12G0122700 [Rhododendron simsii]